MIDLNMCDVRDASSYAELHTHAATFSDFYHNDKPKRLVSFSPKIIGLTGKARSGKDTVGDMLEETFCAKRVAFADPIRAMLAAGFGLTHEHFHGKLKEVEIPWLGKSPRQMMQTLGTEWGRGLVHPDIWLMLAERKTLEYNDQLKHVVITDVRFENEAALIRRFGGTVWHIQRDNAQAVAFHASEAGVAYCTEDKIIDNNGSLDELFDEVADNF